MKVLMVNVVCGIRSTGRICTDLATALEAQGHEVKIAYGREMVPEKFQKYAVRIGSNIDVKIHGIKARLLDGAGFGSKKATEHFIDWVKEYDPDVIHLHNIHGYYINVEELFEYLKTCGKRIIWTMHDCWAFTGHCTYFEYVGCDKWKSGCDHCISKKAYPTSYGLDQSRKHYRLKRKLFVGLRNMIVVTPSEWLAGLIKQSYMSSYSVKVIHNGVNTEVFKPTPSDLREKYHLQGKKIVLGVAAVWGIRKGLDSFVKLSEMLDKNYVIILVGLTAKQIKELPANIIGITRTDSAEELAAFYSLADVFVNPTLEDNYPTTNIEAIACGTPVVSYDTGGSVESARMYGKIVPQKDVEGLKIAIEDIQNAIRQEFNFDNEYAVTQYVELYESLK